jgi:hypothetical protein
MTPVPDSTVDAGATNMPGPSPSTPKGVQAVRDELSPSSSWVAVEALAALMEPEAFDPNQLADEGWRERTRNVALGHAASVIMCADYRRVVEDDETIERLARVIWASTLHPDLADDGSWKWAKSKTDGYHARARAVVRALRNEGRS